MEDGENMDGSAVKRQGDLEGKPMVVAEGLSSNEVGG